MELHVAISHAAAGRIYIACKFSLSKCHISSGICGAIYLLQLPERAGMDSVYNHWLGVKV